MMALQGPAPAEDQLLLSIYSQLTEPDGIYAAVRSRKLASQLHLFQHEGSWPKVLLACDLLLRQALAVHTLHTGSWLFIALTYPYILHAWASSAHEFGMW